MSVAGPRDPWPDALSARSNSRRLRRPVSGSTTARCSASWTACAAAMRGPRSVSTGPRSSRIAASGAGGPPGPASGDDARARSCALLFPESHAGDETPERRGELIDARVVEYRPLERQAGRIGEVSDRDVHRVRIAHHMQPAVD